MGRRNLLLAVQDHPYIYVVVGEISRSIIICWEFEIWNIQYSEKLMVSGKMYSVQYHTVALSYRYHKYYIFQQYDFDCYRCKYSTVDGGVQSVLPASVLYDKLARHALHAPAPASPPKPAAHTEHEAAASAPMDAIVASGLGLLLFYSWTIK